MPFIYTRRTFIFSCFWSSCLVPPKRFILLPHSLNSELHNSFNDQHMIVTTSLHIRTQLLHNKKTIFEAKITMKYDKIAYSMRTHNIKITEFRNVLSHKIPSYLNHTFELGVTQPAEWSCNFSWKWYRNTRYLTQLYWQYMTYMMILFVFVR